MFTVFRFCVSLLLFSLVSSHSELLKCTITNVHNKNVWTLSYCSDFTDEHEINDHRQVVSTNAYQGQCYDSRREFLDYKKEMLEICDGILNRDNCSCFKVSSHSRYVYRSRSVNAMYINADISETGSVQSAIKCLMDLNIFDRVGTAPFETQLFWA